MFGYEHLFHAFISGFGAAGFYVAFLSGHWIWGLVIFYFATAVALMALGII